MKSPANHSPVAMGELYLNLSNNSRPLSPNLVNTVFLLYLHVVKEIHVFLVNYGESLQCSYRL